MKNSKLKGFFAKVTIETSGKDFINLNEELLTKVKGGKAAAKGLNIGCTVNNGCIASE